MEAMLSCFFDTAMANLGRSGLAGRHKRGEMVDYLTTVVWGCCQAGYCDQRTAVSHAVTAALNYHESSREGNSNICLMGKFHNVLYVIAKLCFTLKYDDSQMVAEILRNMYHCETSFERLFMGAVVGVNATHFISGWKCDFKNRQENVDAVHYFIDHAVRTKLEFIYKKGDETLQLRFLDIPIESYNRLSPLHIALQFGSVDLVKLFLAYGAKLRINYDKKSDWNQIEALLNRVNNSCSSRKALQGSQDVQCLQMLLRCIPTLSDVPPVKGAAASNTEGSESIDDDAFRLSTRLVAEGFVPPSRCGMEPPELKHLCRCAVRGALWRTCQLPHGIPRLDLPQSLQDYLELRQD